MLLHDVASVFKAQNRGLLRESGHAAMIYGPPQRMGPREAGSSDGAPRTNDVENEPIWKQLVILKRRHLLSPGTTLTVILSAGGARRTGRKTPYGSLSRR